MTDKLVVAVVQRAFGADRDENREATVTAIEEAIAGGAGIIVPPELFEGRYFPQSEEQEYFAWATTPEDNPAIAAVQKVTAGTGAVVPVSFFEAARPVYFNSVAVVEDGHMLGIYRKSHIPDGPGYEEKFYFSPGDTGFRTWPTRHGRLGVGICWDQWFPEAARAMALQGADVLVYPTAIGNEVGSQAGNDSVGHVAAGHGGPRRLQSRTGRGGQPGRHRRRPHVLRVVLRGGPPWQATGAGGPVDGRDHLCRAGHRTGDGRPCRMGSLP